MVDDDDTITLVSRDDQSFEVPVGVMKMSTTVANLTEDAGTEQPIPLPNVDGAILARVIEFCTYHHEHPVEETKPNERPKISEWDKEFTKVDQPVLFEMMLAANYMEVHPMLSVLALAVAHEIMDKTTEEIRQYFGIENDFTPEEEEQVHKENEWCEEVK